MKTFATSVRFLINKTSPFKKSLASTRKEDEDTNIAEANSLTLLDLPEDILAVIFEYLDVLDIMSCEVVSRKMRYIIVHYNIYRRILDRKCRMKGINNYMTIPGSLSEQMTMAERNEYYKRRLYHYLYVKIYSRWLEMYEEFRRTLKAKSNSSSSN